MKSGSSTGGAHTVKVKVRYSDFTTLTRQISMKAPLAEASEIYRLARKLNGFPVKLESCLQPIISILSLINCFGFGLPPPPPWTLDIDTGAIKILKL